MSEQYYIGGKRYSPEESTVLCAYEWFGRSVALYRSPKGALFLVEKGDDMETAVKVITEAEAFEFMDAHPAGIITENYDAAFGKPEPG